jgi:hypothetical protein
MGPQHTGISNRKSGDDEARDRQDHRAIDPSSPPPTDAGGHEGEAPLESVPNRQTSHKAGSRSIAQKEDASKYPDRSMPPSRKVAGAFGKEPSQPDESKVDDSTP